MNKPLLIIICDFLLISLLSLASFDIEPPNAEEPELSKAMEPQSAQDMLDALKLALEEEQQSQESLEKELSTVREDLSSTQAIVKDQERNLDTIRENLAATELRAEDLEDQRSRLEKDFENTQKNVAFLQEQYVATRTEAQSLQKDLASSNQDAAVSQAKLQTIQSELSARRSEAANMQQKIDALEKARRANEAEKLKLALDLRQSQTEAIVVREQLAVARDDVSTARNDVAFARNEVVNARSEVKIARTEVAVARSETARVIDEKNSLQRHAEKLATGVGTLAEKSEEIKDQIRNNTPLTANSIYNEFRNNQIDTRFVGTKAGLFGQRSTREKEAKNIIVTDGERYFILYHIADTPLSLATADTNWEQLTGVVTRGQVAFSIPVLAGLALDPRILVVPVGESQAQQLGCKIYELAEDPYQFQEAVLVGSRKSYFGEVTFKLNPKYDDYVRMERPALGKLFGQFAPSKWDLVFSKTGQLLGIMANTKHCVVFDDITMNRQIKLGIEVPQRNTTRVLGQMRSQLQRLPVTLQ